MKGKYIANPDYIINCYNRKGKLIKDIEIQMEEDIFKKQIKEGILNYFNVNSGNVEIINLNQFDHYEIKNLKNENIDYIDKLYKKLDDQRIWYLDQIADIKNELDRVNKAWIKEHSKINNAIEYILKFDYYIPEDNKNELLDLLYGIDINKTLSENIDDILRGEEC